MLKYFTLIPLSVLALACSSDQDGGLGGFGAPGGPAGGLGGASGSTPGGGIAVPGTTPGTTPGTAGAGNGTITDVPPGTAAELNAAACAGWAAEGESLPAQLELVVDVSSSMNEKAPGGGNRTKWEETRDALLDAVVGVTGPGLPASTAVGVLFYPNRRVTVATQPQDVTQCVQTSASIPIELLGPAGAQHRTRLGTAITGAQLQQSTPTHNAYQWALDNVVIPSRLSGQKFAVIITDGAPTLSLGCMNPSGSLSNVDPQPIVEEVIRAAGVGVKTFLIGSPGSEPNRAWMSQAARIGGTAQPGCSDSGPAYCHIDLTTAANFGDALRDGLAQIAGQVVSCTYDLPTPPAGKTLDLAKINLIYTPTVGGEKAIGRSSTADCTTGWHLTGNQVTLCPATCDAIKQDTGASLQLIFGCGSIDAPPF